MSRSRRIWRIVGIVAAVVVVVLLLAGAGFVLWANNAAQPMPEALAALNSDDKVTVTQGEWTEFKPTNGAPTTGFIFYPGGRVDYRAYAPPLRALAEQGYLTVVTPMPLNLAIIDPERATAVMAAHPEITHWVLGGHSLGGATAAIYLDRHPDAASGIVFWAAYPPDSNSLADQPGLQATSISGTLDGLATPDKIEASRPLLPAEAVFLPIEGGNHAQFGWYGAQEGDNPATVTREEQQRITIEATAQALANAGQ